MKVLVTGATGFVGQYVIPQLLKGGHDVLGIGLDDGKITSAPWRSEIHFLRHDIRADATALLLHCGSVDVVVHLAWSNMSNCTAREHLSETLPSHYAFLRAVVRAGVRHVLVAGTCLEYGMQCGLLDEDMTAMPTTPYGQAKNNLRQLLQALQMDTPFTLQWVRLFYLYGPGQRSGSLLAQLDQAIDAQATSFKMSPGDQLRDYLRVDEAARRIAVLINRPDIHGIINCCDGKPTSVLQFVERRIKERGANIQLETGSFSYPEYEPFAFWGGSKLMEAFHE